jgi:hypothetical protein
MRSRRLSLVKLRQTLGDSYPVVKVLGRLRCGTCRSKQITVTFLAPHQAVGNLAHLFEQPPLWQYPLPSTLGRVLSSRLGGVPAKLPHHLQDPMYPDGEPGSQFLQDLLSAEVRLSLQYLDNSDACSSPAI